MSAPAHSEIGALIERLGAALEAGTITRADALAELMAADPTLHEHGAAVQLAAWRTATARYRAACAPTPATARVNARTLTARPPIVFRIPARKD